MKKFLIVLCLLGLIVPFAFADSTKFDNIRTGVVEVNPSTHNGYLGYHCYVDKARTFLIDASLAQTSTMDTWLGPSDGVGVTVFIHPRSGAARPESKDLGEEIIIQKVDSGTTDIVITCVNLGSNSGITAWDTENAIIDPAYSPITTTTLTQTEDSPSGVTDRLTLDAQWDYVWFRLGGPQSGVSRGESGTSFYRIDYRNN